MAAWLLVAISMASCQRSLDDRGAPPPNPTTTATVPITPPPTAEFPSAPDPVTTTAKDEHLTPASRLRLDGIGPVRVGMTTAEASRSSGKRIAVDPDSGPNPASCGFAVPTGGPDISFMVIDGKVQRVDVGPGSSVATVSGVRIGDTEAEVGRIYGERLRVGPHPYREGGHYLIYDSAEPSQRDLLLIFETDGATVTAFGPGGATRYRLPRAAPDPPGAQSLAHRAASRSITSRAGDGRVVTRNRRSASSPSTHVIRASKTHMSTASRITDVSERIILGPV